MYTSARVSLVSLTSQCTHHPTNQPSVRKCKCLSDRCVASCYWRQNNLSDTTVSFLLLSTVQHLAVSLISLLQDDDELHCLNVLLGHQFYTVAQSQNIISDRYELMRDLDQCVKVSSCWIVFFNDWMLWLKNNCASVFCRKLFCLFPVTTYIYIVCIFCNFVTWCILYFLCYNWYFVLHFLWLVKDALT